MDAPLLLAGSLVANVLLYRKARLSLFEEGDRPLIERTIGRMPIPRSGTTFAAGKPTPISTRAETI